MNRGEMIDAVVKQGGFDTSASATSRDVVASWLNEVLGRLVADSQWAKQAVDLGPTVVGEHEYALADNVIDVRTVYVDGSEYVRSGASEMLGLRNGTTYLVGGYGAFAPGYNAAGTAVVDIYPTPEEAGKSITALCAMAAVSMTADTDVPMVPADFHQALVDGAIGIGLHRVYERHDDAAVFDARFSSEGAPFGAVQRLKRRANSRIGSGPQRFRIVS